MHNKAIYTTWGPHQRMTHPDPALLDLREIPEDEWNLDQICGGVWTIFPHISIAGGNGGGQVAQLFPGTRLAARGRSSTTTRGRAVR